MSDYLDINNHSGLLQKYDKYMLLTMFIDSDDYELKNKYLDAATKHNNKIFNYPILAIKSATRAL